VILLEYLAVKLLGYPIERISRKKGQATWQCWNCGHRTWQIRPPLAGYKDKFKCWNCDNWGDEFDLLRHGYPHQHFHEHQELLNKHESEFTAFITESPDATLDEVIIRPGEGGGGDIIGRSDDEHIERVYKRLSQEDRAILAEAMLIARREQVELHGIVCYAYHSDKERKKRQRVQQARAQLNGQAAKKPKAGDQPSRPRDYLAYYRQLPKPRKARKKPKVKVPCAKQRRRRGPSDADDTVAVIKSSCHPCEWEDQLWAAGYRTTKKGNVVPREGYW
jgi:hypothetical protein